MERTLTFTDSLFYDVSAWTFPLAYGAVAAEVERAPRMGPPVDPAFDGGRLVGGRASVAYLVRWDRYFAPRALRRLQEAGVRVRLAQSPFEAAAGGARQPFGRGTLVVPVQSAGAPADTVHAVVARAVAQDHVEAFALDSGLTPAGADLGSRSWPVLEAPRVALLAGEGTDANGVGEVWHLLSERFGQPVTLVDPVALPDLDAYRTLVLAHGSYHTLDSAATARVRDWVRGRGRPGRDRGRRAVGGPGRAGRGPAPPDGRRHDRPALRRPRPGGRGPGHRRVHRPAGARPDAPRWVMATRPRWRSSRAARRCSSRRPPAAATTWASTPPTRS